MYLFDVKARTTRLLCTVVYPDRAFKRQPTITCQKTYYATVLDESTLLIPRTLVWYDVLRVYRRYCTVQVQVQDCDYYQTSRLPYIPPISAT